MASLNIDANNILQFALRWLFAGFWAFFGFALARYVDSVLPWP